MAERQQEMRMAVRAFMVMAGLVGALGLSGCLVAGYSSGGGWFVWPGSIGITVVLVVLYLVLRRR